MATGQYNSELYNKGQEIKIPSQGPTRRSAVNESKIEYVELNANPIQGCSHACKYCYARKIDLRFKKVESEKAWHNPKIFSNFFERLEQELSRGKIDTEKEIFLSTMTDLYQPVAASNNVGRKLILLLQSYDCTYRILTKSTRILQDKDILNYDKGKVGLSITTNSDNEEMKAEWEPKTPNIQARLNTLKELSDAGDIRLWVSAEPFLPSTDFDKYYQEIHEYGGNSLEEVIIGKMNYEAGMDKKFDWEHVVKISEKYRQQYLENNKFGNKPVRYHYKKEFWNYLEKHNLRPYDLDVGKSEYCRDNRS